MREYEKVDAKVREFLLEVDNLTVITGLDIQENACFSIEPHNIDYMQLLWGHEELTLHSFEWEHLYKDFLIEWEYFEEETDDNFLEKINVHVKRIT